MAEERRVVAASELETMTPQERADTIRTTVVTRWDHVPADFRARIDAKARELGAERRARD